MASPSILMRLTCFNSRTPGGVRPSKSLAKVNSPRFQFTHPGRGATRKVITQLESIQGFNSRTPGGVRRDVGDSLAEEVKVSIHAPREGCDVAALTAGIIYLWFQFTHPGRGATAVSWRVCSEIVFQFTHPGRGATSLTDVVW